MTRVVNLKRENYDVFIGRAGIVHPNVVSTEEGTFGNLYRASTFGGGVEGRQEALAHFRRYLKERAAFDAKYRAQMLSLRGKVLGCFCKPLPCHGDVIVEWLEWHP